MNGFNYIRKFVLRSVAAILLLGAYTFVTFGAISVSSPATAIARAKRRANAKTIGDKGNHRQGKRRRGRGLGGILGGGGGSGINIQLNF